jgi:hypothetical protein
MTVVMECRRVLGLQVIVVLVTILAQPSHTLVVVIWGAHGRCFRCAWAPAPSPEFAQSAQQHLPGAKGVQFFGSFISSSSLS